ncbi:hypothetical protein FCM35_KLT02029 [Carex littledalei]|uniref:Uncharacterized protein n=1 Tax=Carex littledalei TaxID=544730 RepID=A0A833R684_9POAL|nr:hypothetical protein FCM35_KLT02029 [Carex littledalei]
MEMRGVNDLPRRYGSIMSERGKRLGGGLLTRAGREERRRLVQGGVGEGWRVSEAERRKGLGLGLWRKSPGREGSGGEEQET